ncbi:MAG: hypothetical protein JNK46_07350 [Methylobacteriaceae bacterium]|nr:hypothetical protein [Methylobacteriaceae bacterium]
MTEALAPDAIAFRLSRDKPMKGLLLGVLAMVGVGVWIFIERGGDGLLIIGFFLIVFAFWHWQASRDQEIADVDREPRLILDAEGVTIPQMFTMRAPWSAIDGLSLYGSKHGEYLSLRMERPEDYGFEPHAGQKFARMLGDRTLDFDYHPLDCDKAQLVAALKRYAPPHLTEKL